MLWVEDVRCSADLDEDCFGADPDRGTCAVDVQCHPSSEITSLLALLRNAASEHPDAGFVVAQSVYAHIRLGRPAEATRLASACQGTAWWCDLLIGHSAHAEGRLHDAEARLRSALQAAPDSIQCRFHDVRWVLDPESSQNVQNRQCEERETVADTVWWLADPLYAREGNDRWVEHVVRVHETRLYEMVQGVYAPAADRWNGAHLSNSQRRRIWEMRVPRGTPDSWERIHAERPTAGVASSARYQRWTGLRAARYHFVPNFEDGDLNRPVWRLQATLADEGYTPPYGTFHELPTQIARFRTADTDRDSMRVAVAGTLSGTEMAGADAESHLMLSDAPESFPVHLTSEIHGDRATFLAASPAERYVLSFEVLGDEQFARHRVMLEPLRTDGVGVSDVLLYRPASGEPPEALEAAAELMLGEAAIRSGDELGVYWEMYGTAEGTPVEIEVEIERASRGFFSRLRRLLPGGGVDGAARLAWSDPSLGEVFPRGVVLHPGEMEAGRHTLVVRVSWEGREPFELRRRFEVR